MIVSSTSTFDQMFDIQPVAKGNVYKRD